MTRLSDLLNDSNVEQLSARRMQAIAEGQGVRVSNTSLSKYLRGEPESPSEAVLKAFSLALNVPMEVLCEAVGAPLKESEPFVLPESANRLNSRQHELVLHTVCLLLNE